MIQKPSGIEIEFSQLRVWTFKTAETIESLSQPGSLYSALQNNADQQPEGWSRDLLAKMAAQANTHTETEAATQKDESAVEVNETGCANGGPTSHICKKQAVENGVDGTP